MKPNFLYSVLTIPLFFSCIFYLSKPWHDSAGGQAEHPAFLVDTCFADTLICVGDTLRIGGQVITEPGTYTLTSGLPPECENALVLNVSERNSIEILLDIALCHGENARFGIYTFGRTGYYEIRLPGENGCDTLIYLDLLVSDLGIPVFHTEPDDGSGDGAIDLSISGGGLSFQWSNGATTEDLEGLAAGTYEVTITNSDSCRLVRTVEVEKLESFAVPNAFTPNGDGVNDRFNLVASEGTPQILTFRVYNRWGQLVYENGAPESGWDGTDFMDC